MAERPVECGHCKKLATVTYKEILGKNESCTQMCADCPVLHQKIHGTSPAESPEGIENQTGLFCAHCRTSLESVKMGNPVGCAECYTIFGDLLVNELIEENKIPKRLQKIRRNQPLHIGKTPEKPAVIPSSNRLTALNEALNEALKKENYEEAAWLRDQIKELMDKKNERSA